MHRRLASAALGDRPYRWVTKTVLYVIGSQPERRWSCSAQRVPAETLPEPPCDCRATRYEAGLHLKSQSLVMPRRESDSTGQEIPAAVQTATGRTFPAKVAESFHRHDPHLHVLSSDDQLRCSRHCRPAWRKPLPVSLCRMEGCSPDCWQSILSVDVIDQGSAERRSCVERSRLKMTPDRLMPTIRDAPLASQHGKP